MPLFMVYFNSEPFVLSGRLITQPTNKNRLRAKKTSIFKIHDLWERLYTLALPNFCVIPSHCRGPRFEPGCPYPLTKGVFSDLPR